MDRDDHGIGPSWTPWPARRGPESDFLDWNLWGSWPRLFRRGGEPTVDMYETDNEVVVEADVPGYDPNQISIKVTPQAVTMKGRLESDRNQNKEGYFVREREFGEFTRTVRFPAEVRAESATAKYHDGVLRITASKIKDTQGDSRDLPIQRE